MASRGRSGTVSARTLGALAVAGVVVAFSLSSTLVKRAESPGVLVAFWRLAVATVVWNVFLWSTGRRVTMRDVRQALVPGVFFGLNLAVFFAGATHNSVANAALIGSLSPFLIVPIGAMALQGVQQSACAGVRARRVRRCRHRVVQRTPQGGRVAAGQRVRLPRDVALDGLRGVDAALSPGHGRRHLHGDDLSDRRRRRASAGDRQRRRVRHERHGMDVHADPHVPLRGRRQRADGVRAEDDPDRHDRDRPGGATRARRRVVVPVAGRDAAATGSSSASPSRSAGCSPSS